jgi:prepilin-type N-terminal cleavage/methylation domain-containing protein
LNKLSINDKINIRIGSVQMKKKGFTLIELLAVIVILAIIALIATPLVLKYIGKAREEAAIASAYAYIDAYEKYVANAVLNSEEKINKKEKYYLINNSNYKDSSAANKSIFLNNLVKVNKTMPDDGYLITRDKTHYVKHAIFLYKDIEVECKMIDVI